MGVYGVIVIVYALHFMKKKLYKIKIWRLGDCDLVQEIDRYLSDDETKNFKVVKPYRGTIEEVKKEIQQSLPKQRKSSDKPLLNKKFNVAKIDDGILCADIATDDKDVNIRISGFRDFKRALDWAQLQSVLWKSDQQARDLQQEELKPKITIH